MLRFLNKLTPNAQTVFIQNSKQLVLNICFNSKILVAKKIYL